MTNNNHNLPLKYSYGLGFSLRWNISEEVRHGNHSFDKFRKILLNGADANPRRYAEVLYHKTRQEDYLLGVIEESLAERAKHDFHGAMLIAEEFRDWDIHEENLKARGAR